MQCAKCHGPTGQGDGETANELKDDNGLPIKPRNFSDASQFVGASDPRGVYQTFTTGIDGTPMPSYADNLNEDQRWQLVYYVMSFRGDWNLEKIRTQVQVKLTADAKPASDGMGK
jgi:cytochrome c oxidase cbb3-type subunit 2